jgi:hypothetical protein
VPLIVVLSLGDVHEIIVSVIVPELGQYATRQHLFAMWGLIPRLVKTDPIIKIAPIMYLVGVLLSLLKLFGELQDVEKMVGMQDE